MWPRGFERAPHKPLLVLIALGKHISIAYLVKRRPRDPAFRTKIMRAYEYACAVCGLDVRIGTQPLGIEAAHIQWHQAGGPDEERNGLALCSLHHKAFDLGAFTVQPDQVLVVSEQVYGRHGFDELLLQFHGNPIRRPFRRDYLPNREYLDWHESEVFKRPPRIISSS